mgnify:CR=1 FL=1
MSLVQALECAKSWKGKACLINDFYESRRIKGSLEPIWIHRAYEIVKDYLDDKLDVNLVKIFYDIVRSHELKDGEEVPSNPSVPSSPIRIMHEGWKIGTPTWIFMGRNFSDSARQINSEWVAVSRKVPEQFHRLFTPGVPDTVWLAYSVKNQMDFEGKQPVSWVGPACDLEDLVEVLESMPKESVK